MSLHRLRFILRFIPRFFFMLFMMCVVGAIYHRCAKTPPSETMKIILQGIGGSLAIFLGLFWGYWRAYRNETKNEGGGEP